MTFMINISIAVTVLLFVKRALFGPQKKFALLFFLLTLIGIIGVKLMDPTNPFIYVSGFCLVLAPIVGLTMLATSIKTQKK